MCSLQPGPATRLISFVGIGRRLAALTATLFVILGVMTARCSPGRCASRGRPGAGGGARSAALPPAGPERAPHEGPRDFGARGARPPARVARSCASGALHPLRFPARDGATGVAEAAPPGAPLRLT
jgi:hypothetical protein